MFKKYVLVLTALSLLLLTSCNKVKNNESIYLSIATYDKDSITLYTFDVDTKQLKEHETIKTFAVNPDAIIDPKAHTIYYTERHLLGDKNEVRHNDGDQVYSYNYKTNISIKLTHNLINGATLFKLEDQLLILSKEFNEYRIALNAYDLTQQKQTNLEPNLDISFRTSNLNPITNEFVTTAISETEKDQKYQQSETTNLYENTKNKLYTYKDNQLQYITETAPGTIKTIVINDSYIIYHLLDEVDENKGTYSQKHIHFNGYLTYHRTTKETTPGIININDPNIDQLLYLSEDQTYLICTYKENKKEGVSHRGNIVKYNLVDQTYETLLEFDTMFPKDYLYIAIMKK